MSFNTRVNWPRLLSIALASGLACAVSAADDISSLDQHFNRPGHGISPWVFVPSENIKELSTEAHPGLAMIYEAGRGRDIKGILKDPIRIGDYPLPWEFQTSLVQSFNLMAGVGAKTQVNSAIGMNVMLTFSEESEWPKDRAKRHRERTSSSSWSCTWDAPAKLAWDCRSLARSHTPRLIWSGVAVTWGTR